MNANTFEDNAIAIVGMSCRFAPNLDTPTKFWDFLMSGSTSTAPMPLKRWMPYAGANPKATAALRGTTLLGSYLEDIDGFDAEFFQITPKEAEYLDPQQRFMLELTWEALANAGIAPSSLARSDTGVYAAVNSTDYGRRLLEDLARTGPYAVNGTTDYGIANRVSYFLDLRGPSMAVNTACAASLTAIHIATQALQAGEIPLAIVGGLNLISTPALNVALQGAGALAPDGRSKAFDDDADGYGRGEGAGVVILKRYADASADGDPILAVIRGSGVFQDGRSDGMMAPNDQAQEHMLRSVYERAGIDPGSVGYVEAHGTGTPTGDGAEIRALTRVFGAGRAPEAPCLVGSAKPNVGHVEGGSGLVGIVKVILSFLNETIPPSVHRAPTSSVDWPATGLRLVDAPVPWPAGDAPRRAGVSNYGVGGTIAHLVLEAPPVPPAHEAGDDPSWPVVIPVSGATEAGASASAGQIADWWRIHPEVGTRDILHTLARRRSHLPYRVAIVAESPGQACEALEHVGASAQNHAAVVSGRAVVASGPLPVWVFSGHGAQWPAMARDLLDADAAFTETLDSLEEIFEQEMGWTARDALTQRTQWSSDEVQVLTVAVQIALSAAWRQRGVEPGAVIGHSVGEIAAAVAAGVLDAPDAVRFACRRARALRRLTGRGAMVMAGASAHECAERLTGSAGVQIAIHASPASTVLAGSPADIAAVTASWAHDGVIMRPVASDIAFHSAQIEAIADEVGAAAAQLSPRSPVVPLYSTARDDPRTTEVRDATYWVANVSAPVRFEQAIGAALDDAHRVFLEVSTHPVVSHSILETAEHRGLSMDIAVVATLRRDVPDRLALARSLAGLYLAGVDLGWARNADYDGALVDLPAMAWQHRDYWLFDDDTATAPGQGHDPAAHSLLGGRTSVSGSPPRHVWQTHLDMDSRPYPLSHALVGVEVTPAASLLNSFVIAADSGRTTTLTDIVLRTPLAVEPARIVQIVREGNTLSLASRIAEGEIADAGTEWITHCSATIETLALPPTGAIDLEHIRSTLPTWPEEDVHAMFRRAGVGGYAFPWTLGELRRGTDSQLAQLDLATDGAPAPVSWAHVIDAALTISAALVTPADADGLWMSQAIGKVALTGVAPTRISVLSLRTPGADRASVDAVIADEAGQIVAEVTGLRFSAVDTMGHATSPKDLVFEPEWTALDDLAATGTLAGRRITLIGAAAAGSPVAGILRDRGAVVETAAGPAGAELAAAEEILLLGLPVTSAGATARGAAESTRTLVEVTQAVIAAGAEALGAGPRLWVLTEGVRDMRTPAALVQAPLWGAGRIIAGEHPDLWAGVIDLASPEPKCLERLVAVLAGAAPDEDIIAIDDSGAIWVERLGTVTRTTDKDPLVCSPNGTVLITGGLGDLGLESARWLAERGARRIVLAGRRGLPPRSTWKDDLPESVAGQVAAITSLEALGVSVHIVPVDLSDPDAVRDTFGPGALDLPPITGIVHAAGLVADDLVDNLSAEAVDTVFGPKVTGAWQLHELFPPGSLDFFVLFSSCGQLARLSGQTAYAAGNSFLDGLARLRWAQGDRATTSLAWTSWRGLGLSRSLTTTMLEANTRGLESISGDEALRAWAFSDHFASPYFAMMRVLPAQPGLPRPPALRDLAPGTQSDTELFSSVYAIDPTQPESETRAAVTQRVRDEVAAELHADATVLDVRRPLVEMGVDSVMAVALRVRLTRTFGLEFPPTILWSKPTVSELSDDIHLRLRTTDVDVVPADLDTSQYAGTT